MHPQSAAVFRPDRSVIRCDLYHEDKEFRMPAGYLDGFNVAAPPGFILGSRPPLRRPSAMSRSFPLAVYGRVRQGKGKGARARFLVRTLVAGDYHDILCHGFHDLTNLLMVTVHVPASAAYDLAYKAEALAERQRRAQRRPSR